MPKNWDTKMNSSKTISYILTTYNKCAYLKISLPYILKNIQADEELIIFDGNSKDESRDFIESQIKDLPNVIFISEADKGESHALNKALLLCKGDVIKNLTDDDAFSFYAIRKAAQHLKNSDLDIIGFDGYGMSLHDEDYNFSKTDFYAGYRAYSLNHQPFFFCGLSYLIKKSSLPVLGLFSISYKMVDLEYSFRISSGKCKIGWTNLLCFVNIYNANSNTLLFNKQLEKESKELHKKYGSRDSYYKVYFRFKLQRLLEFKNKLSGKKGFGISNKLDFEKGYYRSVDILEKENKSLTQLTFYP